jgi:hypothetical protein
MKACVYLFWGVCALMALAGCGTPGAPVPPSLELPRPPEDLAVTRKADKVTLSWTLPAKTTDNLNVRLKKLGPILVCRGVNDFPMAKCAQIIDEMAAQAPPQPRKGEKPVPLPRMAMTETLPSDLQQMYPTGFATYAVQAMNSHWRSAGLSNQVRIPLAPTLPPPDGVSAESTANGITVVFDCSGPPPMMPEMRYACRLYRRQQSTNATILLRDIPRGNQPCDGGAPENGTTCRINDNAFEWEQTYTYWVAPVTEVLQSGRKIAEVEGNDSPAATVFTRDIFPPVAPSGLEAVASGVGQKPFVDLTWTPNTDPDLAGYNVYRQEGSAEWVRLNSELVTNQVFRDQNVTPGRTYTYAITAVDLRGNEGNRSQPAIESVP